MNPSICSMLAPLQALVSRLEVKPLQSVLRTVGVGVKKQRRDAVANQVYTMASYGPECAVRISKELANVLTRPILAEICQELNIKVMASRPTKQSLITAIVNEVKDCYSGWWFQINFIFTDSYVDIFHSTITTGLLRPESHEFPSLHIIPPVSSYVQSMNEFQSTSQLPSCRMYAEVSRKQDVGRRTLVKKVMPMMDVGRQIAMMDVGRQVMMMIMMTGLRPK